MKTPPKLYQNKSNKNKTKGYFKQYFIIFYPE